MPKRQSPLGHHDDSEINNLDNRQQNIKRAKFIPKKFSDPGDQNAISPLSLASENFSYSVNEGLAPHSCLIIASLKSSVGVSPILKSLFPQLSYDLVDQSSEMVNCTGETDLGEN